MVLVFAFCVSLNFQFYDFFSGMFRFSVKNMNASQSVLKPETEYVSIKKHLLVS